MQELLNLMNEMMLQNVWISACIALIAGIVASFSPCALSSLPLLLGYVSVSPENNKKTMHYSILFSIGTIITFVLLAIISILLGKNLKLLGNYWYLILACILLFVTLQLFDVIKRKQVCKIPTKKKSGVGAIFLGILGGFLGSTCTTPILLTILALIAQSQSLGYGILLMILYGLGQSTIILIAGFSYQMIYQLLQSESYQKTGKILKRVLGCLTLLLSLYYIYIAV